MKILIAPIHYILDKNQGSEYTRSYYYLHELAKNKEIFGDVLVGYSEERKLGNLNIISLWKQKPKYISNLTRLLFVFHIFGSSILLRLRNKYDLIWHHRPFLMGESFNLIAITHINTPFVLGPIPTPLDIIGNDEHRSMGRKDIKFNSLKEKVILLVDNSTYFLSRVFYFFSIATLKRSKLVFALDSKGKEKLKKMGIGSDKIKVLNIPIKTHIFNGEKIYKKPKYTLLSTGFLVERKRIIDIIESIKILVNKLKVNNIQLIIVGDGPQRKMLEEIVHEYKLSKYVFFKGFIPREKVYKEYFNADIFITASLSDTMPSVYYEALSAGLPIITAQNGSVKDLIREQVSLISVSRKSPVEIAQGIAELVKNPIKMQKMSENNLKLAKKELNIEVKFKEFVEILNTL